MVRLQRRLTLTATLCPYTPALRPLAGRALPRIGREQGLKDAGMRRVGAHRARDAAGPRRMQPTRLAAERDAPSDRPAPVVPDDGELTDAQRIGEREDVGDQLVGGIGFGVLRL